MGLTCLGMCAVDVASGHLLVGEFLDDEVSGLVLVFVKYSVNIMRAVDVASGHLPVGEALDDEVCQCCHHCHHLHEKKKHLLYIHLHACCLLHSCIELSLH